MWKSWFLRADTGVDSRALMNTSTVRSEGADSRMVNTIGVPSGPVASSMDSDGTAGAASLPDTATEAALLDAATV